MAWAEFTAWFKYFSAGNTVIVLIYYDSAVIYLDPLLPPQERIYCIAEGESGC